MSVLKLSEILIQEFEINSYAELKETVKQRARQGVMLFEIDVKPPYADTPANWEADLEGAFTSV